MQNPFGTHFVEIRHPFRCSFGCVLLLNRMFWKQRYRSTIPLRNLSGIDQPALEIRIRI